MNFFLTFVVPVSYTPVGLSGLSRVCILTCKLGLPCGGGTTGRGGASGARCSKHCFPHPVFAVFALGNAIYSISARAKRGSPFTSSRKKLAYPKIAVLGASRNRQKSRKKRSILNKVHSNPSPHYKHGGKLVSQQCPLRAAQSPCVLQAKFGRPEKSKN